MQKIGMPEEEIYTMDDDESVCIDLGDMEDPVCVDVDGWMSLEDAESLYALLGVAITTVKEHAETKKI